jgi:hypothetical protein
MVDPRATGRLQNAVGRRVRSQVPIVGGAGTPGRQPSDAHACILRPRNQECIQWYPV